MNITYYSRTVAMSLIYLAWCPVAMADSVAARCDSYPAGDDHAQSMQACQFSQRQGYISIRRADGVVHELSPLDTGPGNFRDDAGQPVYRVKGLGDQGQVFRFASETLYVYWDTRALNPSPDSDNWTAPFSTADFDATTRIPCRQLETEQDLTCPAGVLRMKDGQASVVVQSPVGEKFTINFMRDSVTATNREVAVDRDQDGWRIVVDGTEEYRVPLAVIEGG